MDFLDLGSDVVQEEERDSTGGLKVFDADIHEMIIKTAYLDKSEGGANNVTVLFETPKGESFKLVEYITSKAGKNYYIDKKDGKTKRPMVGLVKMNSLSKLVKGTDLGKQVIEDKVHKIWDKSQSKEVPQTRKTFVEWKDQVVHLGLHKIVENKSVKNDGWKEGMPNKERYLPTAETRETNVVDKYFDKNKATNPEVEAGVEPAFFEDWLKVNKGLIKDKTDKSLKSGAPNAAGVPSTEPLDFD